MLAAASAVRAIADECAIASTRTVRTLARAASAAAETAASAAATEAAATESTAAESAASSSKTSARASRALTARNRGRLTGLLLAGLFLRAESLGAAKTTERPEQAEIVLAILQAVAERSIYQEGLVGVLSRLRARLRRRRRSDLFQFILSRVLGNVPESALLRGAWPLGELAGTRLQFQGPFQSRGSIAGLCLFARGLKAEHLDFDCVCSRRQVRQFVLPGLIGGG